LTPQHQLHVVELAGRRLIVGTGPAGAPRLVCELPASTGVVPLGETPRGS
jgi:hypothetical protein